MRIYLLHDIVKNTLVYNKKCLHVHYYPMKLIISSSIFIGIVNYDDHDESICKSIEGSWLVRKLDLYIEDTIIDADLRVWDNGFTKFFTIYPCFINGYDAIREETVDDLTKKFNGLDDDDEFIDTDDESDGLE